MKVLENILQNINILESIGKQPETIEHIQFDSRLVKPNDIFVAVPGTQVDGHLYIESCIEKGAKVIVCEHFPSEINKEVAYIKVANSSYALGVLASNFYDNPSEKLELIGITGTNGKTSTVTMLFNLFRNMGFSVGLLSTVENKIDDRIIKATHTTPDALQLNQILAEMVNHGCSYAFMEVSSHALVQNRVAGLNFKAALFSNITHDHLDFHKTFKEYIRAKKLLFDNLSSEAFAIINIDDKNGRVMVQNTKAKVLTFSLRAMSDYRARILDNSFDGLQMKIDEQEIWIPLVGKFNAENLMAVYSTAMSLGFEQIEILRLLSTIETAKGRFENIKSDTGVTAIVDYAHTPDALKNVLSTINEIRQGQGTLITVVGAGGNRDKTKRPEMAAIAAQLSNRVILTSDNPRMEEPEDIIRDMEAGIPIEVKAKVLSITNRKEAIKTAIALAQKGDIILVAGKGHENYQDIKGVKHHFDDTEIIKEFLS